MKPRFRQLILAATAATSLFPGVAHAQVDASKSTVTTTSKQMNVPVDGTFKKFTAQLIFDPTKPTAGSAQLTIDTASYDLGDESYDQQVRGKDWFDSAQFPNATLVSSAIAPAGGNQFKVSGKLTIKGKSENVTVPVTVTQLGATLTFDGTLPIKRSQFDIGLGEWKDTSVVADEVLVKFHIVEAKK
ncbi:YceI family protein [Caballeronia sp. SEWSISQ10-4 2]|uniref:YceI family protein n=1 Tax=Caballeronia sp. SEWSISQ10-4 2 TaxID=2937438 RepID=UPI00264B36AF|nr:YceI family protein [Caballeronia sp. SEWSISQ10-4 2]MDN7182226.1 YceI family protein [Caballeronia sp. SEWSISQ10-4 2]